MRTLVETIAANPPPSSSQAPTALSPEAALREESIIQRTLRNAAFDVLNDVLQDAWTQLDSEMDVMNQKLGETLWNAFGETIQKSQEIMDVFLPVSGNVTSTSGGD